MLARRLISLVSSHALVVGLAISLAAIVSPTASAKSDHITVPTDNGPVEGLQTDTMNKFLGIPYAAPPVGENRWRPPQPAARWETPRDATQFANHCPQVGGPFGIGSTTEDCLFLNVYTPTHTHGHHPGEPHGHPVMVWIHGGGLTVGLSDGFDPTPLVTQGDVVVVTINYRLGILGYLGHPALSAEGDGASGNYGFMDQQAAMQWVQRNIHHFGGDADNVTVFGESAGGLSTQTQLASPLGAGLFHRAIVESGAYAINTRLLRTTDGSTSAESLGVAFAGRKGCPGTDAAAAACLRALTVDQILAPDPATGTISAPTVDGKVLTQTLRGAFTSGQFNQVPIMQGTNHDEFTLFIATVFELATPPIIPTPANYPVLVRAVVGAAAGPGAVALYPVANYQNASAALAAVGTDFTFTCPARTSARLQSAFVPVYAYEFNDPNAPQLFLPPISIPYKAYHASEIQYLFNSSRNGGAPAPFDANQQQLSNAMVSYWTNFARSANPNSADTPSWPQYGATDDLFQSLEPPTPVTIGDFSADHKCDFWAQFNR